MALDKDKVKLFVTDERMLKLMEWSVDSGIVETQGEYLGKVGALKSNAWGYRNGSRRFTVEQILEAAKLTKANINWIFGLEKDMLLDSKSISAIDRLKSAVIAVEHELQAKKRR